MARFRPPGDCPNCDGQVPARAKACPSCGATAQAGWDDPLGDEGLDLPDADDFDYDAYVEREFGTAHPKRTHGRRWLWPVVALVLVGAFLWFAFGHLLNP